VSNSDQDEAAPNHAWQESGNGPAAEPPAGSEPDTASEPTPSWLGYPAESTEYTVPHTYTASGYADAPPPDGAGNYPPAPPPPAPEYTAPRHFDAPAPADPSAPPVPPAPSAPAAAPEMPAGAGLVPPRADALPPAPPPAPAPAPAPAGPPPAAPPPAPPAPNTTSAPAPPPYLYPGSPRPEAAAPAPPAAPPAPTAPGQVPWQQPQAPAETPRPEDLLVPDRPSIQDAPATWGWRGRVNKMSAGAIKPKAKPAELLHRQAVLDIQHGFSRPMTVVVIQPKGGAGKTPTTIGLAAALGAHRGGYVVGWDDNETRGTLAVRTVNRDSQRTTVWDFLGSLPSFERLDARVGDLSYYVRSQGEAYFDALVSDDHPGNMAQIGEEEFRRIHTVLQRFYRIIVIDTGNNVRSPNWQAAVNAADVVVIPSTYQRDVGYSGSWVLDHLLQTGREGLAQHAVTVLTAADPSTDTQVRHELQRHFGARTQDVIEIPYDEHIATGGPIHWANLAEDTRRAYTRLGAVVVSALVRRDTP
jgi:MinD-like ATPase involved in chromosome partitioning or flagellar assembly